MIHSTAPSSPAKRFAPNMNDLDLDSISSEASPSHLVPLVLLVFVFLFPLHSAHVEFCETTDWRAIVQPGRLQGERLRGAKSGTDIHIWASRSNRVRIDVLFHSLRSVIFAFDVVHSFQRLLSINSNSSAPPSTLHPYHPHPRHIYPASTFGWTIFQYLAFTLNIFME